MSNIDLRHGDCLELMKSIPDKSIDMVLTDPPYGTTQCKWDTVIPFEPMWKELNRVIKDNGAILLFGSEPFSSNLRLSNIKMYKYDWIWNKLRTSGSLNARRQPLRTHEVISVFYKKQCTYYPIMTTGKMQNKASGGAKDIYGKSKQIRYSSDQYYPRTILEFKACHNMTGKVHPTEKPVELLEYLIKTYTTEGQTILDFTMGSGSTGVASKNLSRNFIGIELDDKYFQIAKDRIDKA